MDIEPRYIEIIKHIADYEQEHPFKADEPWRKGWKWDEVAVPAATINKLLTLGMVIKTYSSRSTKEYMLSDKAKAILASGSEVIEAMQDDGIIEPTFTVSPESMFSDIIGYDDEKELIRECLQLDKPIHNLLVGPPSIAKTMFLLDIERAGGGQAMWILGSASSKAGIWDKVADIRPRWLLIDELDKMAAIDHAALLSLMERGRIVRTKVHRLLDITINIWVVASANRIEKLPPELLSRFKISRLQEYNTVEYVKVVRGALAHIESMDENSAAEIATRLAGKTHDIRDAIRVARLSKRVGVQRAIELLID